MTRFVYEFSNTKTAKNKTGRKNRDTMLLNKILLGDAFELIKEIPDKSVDMIYTDIPYLYMQGGVSVLKKLGQRAKKMEESLKEISNGIAYSIFHDFIRVCKKTNIFIWCSRLQMRDVLNFFKNYNYTLLVWTKNNPIPTCNQRYLEDIEICLHFRESGVKLNDGYELKSKWYNSSTNKADKEKYSHPTIKPLELVERHILHASQPGDIILDPFIGSGTTAVAAMKNGRSYIGFEKNKEWYRIACNRLKGEESSGQLRMFVR